MWHQNHVLDPHRKCRPPHKEYIAWTRCNYWVSEVFFCTFAHRLLFAIFCLFFRSSHRHQPYQAHQPHQLQSQSRPDQPDQWLSIIEPGCVGCKGCMGRLCLFGVSGLSGLSGVSGLYTDLWQFPMYKHTLVSTSTFSSFRDLFHLFPNLDYIRRNPLKHSNCNGFKLCILCEEGDAFDVGRGHGFDVT